MRLPILALLLFAAAMALTDVSIYKQLRKLGHRWLTTAHIAVSAIIYIVLAVIAAFAKSQAGEEFFIMMMWGLFSAISVSAAKLIYMPFYAISMIPRLRQSRAMRKWRIAGIAIGAAVLLTMWWGAIVTPRQLEVNNVTITSANLPAAFDGYRILQVSDLHTGTYGNRTSIMESIVKEINAQHADLVVVTGDIVNRKTDEISPFIPTLRQIKAKDGVIRFRCWDSCMYSDFTQMAGGNPRTTQTQRFRQRFMHKLVYYPKRYGGTYSCVGCGRCVEKCPQHLNIVKVIKEFSKDGKEGE